MEARIKKLRNIQLVFRPSTTLLKMRPKLQSPRFGALRDEAVWKSVTTDGRTIRWIDDMGYSYEMAEYEVNQFASGL